MDINFCVVPYPHAGEDLGKALEACLLGWDIEKLCITVDHASNNEGMIKYLKNDLFEEGWWSSIKRGRIS